MLDAERRNQGASLRWDGEFDVVVVGYGYAGGIAAIEAADAGADVLIMEKMPDPGGISICSGGNVRTAADPDDAFAYLQATSAGTTPDDVLRTLAVGMSQLPGRLNRLAALSGAETTSRRLEGNYPFPGSDTFSYTSIASVPQFDPAARYPHVSSYVPIHRAAGVRMFKVIEDNVAERKITVWLDSPALRLLRGNGRKVLGVAARHNGAVIAIRARKAVVLACGGFEADAELQRQYWQQKPVLNAAFLGNTGDGIRMAQDVGAALWHMWHFHGSYGLRHPDPGYPYGVRLKRLPDWIPGKSARADVRVPWIVVDRRGRRYMNEYPPYTQDTSHRPMQEFDPETQSYLRIPSFIVLDEAGRRNYPLCNPTFNDRTISFAWSQDTLRELELRILGRVDSVPELATAMGVEEGILVSTLEDWNAACAAGRDATFGRPPSSMVEIATPPFYFAEVWPVCSNTHGGPVHDVEQRVLDPYGEPIPHLFAAGELGGVFGHLYLGGGNLAECFVGGWIAGRRAAELQS